MQALSTVLIFSLLITDIKINFAVKFARVGNIPHKCRSCFFVAVGLFVAVSTPVFTSAHWQPDSTSTCLLFEAITASIALFCVISVNSNDLVTYKMDIFLSNVMKYLLPSNTALRFDPYVEMTVWMQETAGLKKYWTKLSGWKMQALSTVCLIKHRMVYKYYFWHCWFVKFN